MTRRRLLAVAAGAAGAATGGAAYGIDRLLSGGASPSLPAFTVGQSGATLRFRSRPDLAPPAVAVTGATTGAVAGGQLLLGPGSTAQKTQQGPMIVGDGGELTWFSPVPHGRWVTNVSVSTFRRRPVLAWWEGKVIAPGFGQGEAVIADSAYRQVRRVRAGNGLRMDLHELVLTPSGTALFTCYPPTVPVDLSAVGGPRSGRVQEAVFQEVDLASNRVLMEWHSLDHIPVTESYKPVGEPYDYLHINSIDVAPDGNLLVSARHTWAVYKVNRRTGAIMWRLGGKRSDFSMGSGARFSWQHDARALPPGQITLFDDGSDGPTDTEKQSRGLVLNVDEAGRRATVAREYRHPRALLAVAMGSFQTLAGDRALVGWGTAPYTSEFGANGTLLSDARLPAPLYTYRARRARWTAVPAEPPALAVQRAGAASTLYASWNGATDVARWKVHRGPSPHRLAPAGTAVRRGFETAVRITGGGYAAVGAVDHAGREVARSAAVRV